MKTICSLLCFFVLLSCNKDDDNEAPNLNDLSIAFPEEFNQITKLTDSNTTSIDFELKLVNTEIFSPNDSFEEIDVLIEVDEEQSTAIAGVHYEFSSGTYSVLRSENYILSFNLSVLGPNTPNEPYSKEVHFTAQIVGAQQKYHGIFTINYECFNDLEGTYLVTNDFCHPTSYYDITWNSADQNWTLGSADGNWVTQCTAATMPPQPGHIEVECNGNVLPLNDSYVQVQYEIGIILSGSWNQESGILTMQHVDHFYNNGPHYYESTWVRQ